jgi:RNA polymerase sigma-70 factor (ECF subfamily)
MWTLVAEAGHGPALGKSDPRLALIQRYQGAAYRYLLAAVRDPDVADELFQEFALRVVQGRFSRAGPTKGRFRDYLKSALVHLVTDHYRARRKRSSIADPALLEAVATDPEPLEVDASFLASLRDELLARAWANLAEAEQRGGPSHYSVLRFRADHPALSSPEMAAQLNAQLRPTSPFTDTSVRKALQRARAAFADFLVADVAHSLGHPTAEELQQELIDLGLLDYCAPALARRHPQG